MQYGMARCTRQVRPRDRCDGSGVKIVKVIWWIPTSSRKPSVPGFPVALALGKDQLPIILLSEWRAQASYRLKQQALFPTERGHIQGNLLGNGSSRHQSTNFGRNTVSSGDFWSTERERKAGGIWWNLPGFLRQTPLYPSGFGVAGAYSREAFEGEHPLERMSEEEARMFQRGSHSLPLCPAMPGYARLCPAIPGYALVVTCISDCTGTSIWRDSDGWQKRSDSRRFQRGTANWSPCTWTSLFARPRPENGL